MPFLLLRLGGSARHRRHLLPVSPASLMRMVVLIAPRLMSRLLWRRPFPKATNLIKNVCRNTPGPSMPVWRGLVGRKESSKTPKPKLLSTKGMGSLATGWLLG